MNDDSGAPPTPATGRMLGRYRLEALLGRGGMAEVYQATDTKLARTVAVKVILPSFAAEEHFLERFLREARMVASLEHPNILPVYDFGEDYGVPFLVMPHLPGGSLRERLKAGKIPLAQAASWIAQISSALDAAHAAGVLHRDVKPANVLIGKDGRLFLADFGIAKMLENQAGLTATGIVVGTPIYMAPEQAQGHPASYATDRYALAVVAYEMLAGRPPFVGESALALMHQHVSTPPPALSSRVGGLPAGLDAVLQQALAKDPGARPPTCHALAEAVAAFLPVDLTPAPGPWGTPSFLNTAPTVLSTSDPQPVTQAPVTATWSSRATVPSVRITGETPGLTSDQTVVTGPRSTLRRTAWIGVAAALVLAATWWFVAHRPAATPIPLAVAPAPSPVPAPTSPPAPVAVLEATLVPTIAPTALSEKREQLRKRLTDEDKRIAELESRVKEAEEATKAAQAARAAQAAEAQPTPPPASPELGGGSVEDRVHPLVAARERLDIARNPAHRLSKEDFSFALRESERVLKQHPMNPDAKYLELYARGGLAYVAGNDATASRVLVEAFEADHSARRNARPIENLLRRPDGSIGDPTPWQLAFAYGDARGEAMSLIGSELAVHPRDARALRARAYLRRLQGQTAP